MPEPRWQYLKLKLLLGGLAPWRVRRMIDELDDHFVDIRDEAQRTGLSADAAIALAHERLGNERQLAGEILRYSPASRCWRQLNGMGIAIGHTAASTAGSVHWPTSTSPFCRWGLAIMMAAGFTATLLLILQLAIMTRAL